MTEKYTWTDNPTVSGVAICDTDILNDCLMHLKYENKNENILKTNIITNCTTEIPQDIKLELNDGVLTLKAGSKVYVPNGFEADGSTPKFDEIVIESDISRNSFSTNGVAMVFVNFNNAGSGVAALGQAPVANVGSGTSDPNTGYYYRTNENKLYVTGNWYGYSLPICIGTANGTTITSIDQTFNGFGYIGSTIFALPNVKGLIPNGRNEDGTLNNVEFTTDRVVIGSFPATEERYLVLSSEYFITFSKPNTYFTTEADKPKTLAFAGYSFCYTTDTNLLYSSNGSTTANWKVIKSGSSFGAVVGSANFTNGVITLFTPKQPFRAVDYSEYSQRISSTKAYITETYRNGNSWYRIWSDKFCEQGGHSSANTTVTLFKSYPNINYILGFVPSATDSATMSGNFYINNKTTSSFMAKSSWAGTWYACGYIS